MDYALSTYLFADQRLTSHILDQVTRAGVRQFEVFCARQHFDYQDTNHVRDVAQWFSDQGINLHSLHAPLFDDFDWGRSGGHPISVTYLERGRRIESMDEIKRALEVAERLPFRYLILHLGLPDEAYDLRRFDSAFTSIEHLKIFAKERGVQILLENIPNELSTPDRLLSFIRYTRMEDLKVCLDVGHAHLAGGVNAAFAALKDRIASTHVHDNRGDKDDHLMPFDGAIDWVTAFKAFRSVEGQFPILFELRNFGPEVTSLDKLRDVIEKMEGIR